MHPTSHLKTKALLFLAFLALSFTVFAQTPNLLNYQGVARNAVGNPLPNQTMKLRLSIHNLSPSGTVVYSETRPITTNLGGLFSVQIGSAGATSATGTIASVNWLVGDKHLQVELDPTSNNNFLDIGTIQLVSVPYAFASENAVTVKTNANLTGVVTSVGNQTSIANGAITSDMIGSINQSKVGLDLVNNTSDASKPISTLTQASLNLKANAADVNTSLALKSNTADVNTSLALKANAADVNTSLALKANTASLATVAISGSYNDLTNQPTVPAAYSLPNASASELGGIKVGTGLTITNGVLSASASGVPYTGATQAVDLGAFNLKVNGMTVGRGLNGSSDNNVGIGKDVLRSVTGGSYLTAVGHESLYSNTTGYNNTAIGSAALKANTGGLANTAIGSNSLSNNTTANFNTAVGNHALRNNTGGNNTAVGSGALEFNTSGQQNSAFGLNALKSNTSGSNNTATGVNALESNINGNENTANGANALQSNTEGRENSAFGFSALKSNTTGKYNTATGFNALSKNTTGEQNTATGWYALQANTTGANNTAFGWAALYPNTTGANNTAVGEGALKNNSTGDDNSAFGEGTLANNPTGIYNSAFGRESLHNSNGNNNTAIGWRAGMANTTGSNNTAIGMQADFGANNLTNATAIGYQASVSAPNSIQLGNTAVTNVKTSGTITAGAVTYPKVDGTAGQVLTANANGIPTWQAAAAPAATTKTSDDTNIAASDLYKFSGYIISTQHGNIPLFPENLPVGFTLTIYNYSGGEYVSNALTTTRFYVAPNGNAGVSTFKIAAGGMVNLFVVSANGQLRYCIK